MNSNFYVQLTNEIEHYFAQASEEQLSRDLANANFCFYGQIGEPLIVSKSLGTVSVNPPAVDPEGWKHTVVPKRPLKFDEPLLAA